MNRWFYGKKGNKKSYIILIVLLCFALVIIFTTKSVKEGRRLNFFEKAIKDSTTFVMDVITKPVKIIKNQSKENKEKNKMYKDYKKLKNKAERSKVYEARIKELEKEIDDLKEALELNNTITDYKEINAEVINRNVGAWYNTLNINKGSKSGIKSGMAVIVNQGLIGKIISTSNFTSTVKLLSTDELSNKISVKIEQDDKSIYGLLVSYNRKKNIYMIEGISDNTEIRNGSKVVTTGLSEIFPSGILIGEVKNVTKDKYDLARAVEVTPSVDFNDINIVTVLDRDSK